MSDQDIPRQYRWTEGGRERFAIVEYAEAHGLKPAAARFQGLTVDPSLRAAAEARASPK
jgi:hypothetical protein